MNPLISIIITAKNAEKTIEKTISSVFSLNYDNYELILVDDGSTDKTSGLINKFANHKNVTIIKTVGLGPSQARNIAVGKTKGEYVAFTDSDCIIDKDWLNELLKGFSYNMKEVNPSDIAGVGGDQQSPSDDTEFGKLVQKFMKSVGFITDYVKPASNRVSMKLTNHNPTCNVMYKKTVFNEFTGFIPGLWPGEDVEFDYRLTKSGYRLIYNSASIVYHYRSDNIKKFIRMMFNYGKVQAILVKMHGPFRMIHFVPVLSLMFILIILLLFNYNIIKGILFVDLCCIFTFCYFLIRTKKFDLSMKFFVLFLITFFYWNTGFLKGLVSKSPHKLVPPVLLS